MGKGVALLCLLAGGVVCALALGLLPEEYALPDGPPSAAMLARDHRGSEILGSMFMLALSAGAGWLTFYAPEGTTHRLLPFIPAEVHESVGRLLFGVGMVVCVGMAFWALRRMLR